MKSLHIQTEVSCPASPETSTVARPVAAEDLSKGDYIAILSQCIELLPCYFDCDSPWSHTGQPLRYWFQTLGSSQGIFRIKSICLPWILVKDAQGNARQLDVRQLQLARLTRSYVKTAKKMLAVKR
jgi:hypothetical protein